MKLLKMKYLLGLLLIWGSTLTAMAQYNPDNPAEPGDPEALIKYQVSTVMDISGAGTLTGAGKYVAGTTVTIKATTNSGYKFLYWTKGDDTDVYSSTAQFTYTVEAEKVTFVAHYEKAKSVTVKIDDANAGTVSGSTSSLFKGGTTTISTTPKTNYEFLYWLKDSETEAYSTSSSFVYTMEDADVTFTAVYRYVKPVYNPDDPDEPGDMTEQLSYHVNVALSDEAAGVVSGGGKFKYGTATTIATSPNAGYEFVKWLKGTEDYSTATSFSYTVTGEDVTFTAVYEYVGIPEPVVTSHKLYLVASPAGSCTFDKASGVDIGIDDAYSVTVTPGTDFEFLGWYQNDLLISNEFTYSTYMGTEDVTLTAKLVYNPSLPDEPGSAIVDAAYELGDVNRDGSVDTADAVLVINKYLGKTVDINTAVADMNSDGEIDTADAVLIINKYLNK